MTNDKKLCYFASDGSFGDAKNLVIVDVSEWDDDRWDALERASDWDRPNLAKQFSDLFYAF